MGQALHDLRHSIRLMLKAPGFTAVAIFSLALGIGANTSIFSLVNALFLKQLPGERPQELVSVYTSDFSGPVYGTTSYPDYLELRSKNETLSGLICFTPVPTVLTIGEQAERVYGEFVSGNYFDVLGIRPVSGRWFRPDEDATLGTHPVVVISYGWWERRFLKDPSIVGGTIRLSGNLFTVVGVAPADFHGMFRGYSPEFWVPTMTLNLLQRASNDLTHRGSRSLFVMGRLKPNVTIEQAQANFSVLAAQLHAAYPDAWTDSRKEPRVLSVLPESKSRVFPLISGPILGFMGFLMLVVGLVLMIACSNVANLLLSRSAARRKEIAVRLSLGANRGRLVRQLLTESILLASIAGVCGLLVAIGARRVLSAFEPPIPIPLTLDTGLDITVLLFSAGASLLTGILFGLAPALQFTRPEIVGALKDESALGGYRRSRLRNGIVVAQLALSLLLLVGAGLFVRSLQNASSIDPGFDPNNLLLLSVDLQPQGYDEARGKAFYPQVVERLRSISGVESASLAEIVDLGLGGQRRSVEIEGYSPQPGEDMEIGFNRVGPAFFETMRMPIPRGRSFTDTDRDGAPLVAVVNESFARRYWPGDDPIGKRLNRQIEVVGISKDAKYRTLGEQPRPFYYLPIYQQYQTSATFLLRTIGNPAVLQSVAKAEIAAVDRTLPVFDVKTGLEHMSFALLPARLAGSILGVFGILALLLAAIGIYGVMSYAVSQRTREIGIRVALGAGRWNVLALVVGQGMKLALIGMSIGLIGAFGVTRFAAAFLYGISPTDPVTFIGIAMLLAAVAFAACYIPARRAMGVDPMVALRYE